MVEATRTTSRVVCGLSLLFLVAIVLEVGPLDREFLASSGGVLVASWPVWSIMVPLMVWQRRDPVVPVFLIVVAYSVCCLVVPGNANVTLLQYTSFLSACECSRIVAAAEAHGAKHGWTSTRHGNLSTEDIPLSRIAYLSSTLPGVLATRLQPATEKYFGGILVPRDVFVVRYAQGRQVALRNHFDGGQVTYSIALSRPEDYVGGGIYIPLMLPLNESVASHGGGRTLRLAQGAALIRPAKLRHEGVQLAEGERYLLVSFNDLRPTTWMAHLRGVFDLRGLLASQAVLHDGLASDLGQKAWASSGC